MHIGSISTVSRVFIHPAIHVTIIKLNIAVSGEAVEVLLHLHRGGHRAAALISQRILIGILRRIISQHRIQA